MNDRFRTATGGMPVWVLAVAAAIILGLYVLQGLFNDWVFFIALGVVLLTTLAILRTRRIGKDAADRTG